MFLDVLVPITPVPLDAIGQTGCNVVVNPTIVSALNATDTLLLSIPNNIALEDFLLFTQAVSPEFSPSAVLAMFDRGDVLVGAR